MNWKRRCCSSRISRMFLEKLEPERQQIVEVHGVGRDFAGGVALLQGADLRRKAPRSIGIVPPAIPPPSAACWPRGRKCRPGRRLWGSGWPPGQCPVRCGRFGSSPRRRRGPGWRSRAGSRAGRHGGAERGCRWHGRSPPKGRRVRRREDSLTRRIISLAALLVKVRSRMRSGGMPCSSRKAAR